MSFMDIFRVGKIKAENAELKELFERINAKDAVEVQKKIKLLTTEKDSIEDTIKKIQLDLKGFEAEIEQKRNEIIVVDEELLLESFALYKPKFHFQTSAEYAERLETLRDRQKTLIKSDLAVNGSSNWTVNNSKSEGKKMVNDMKKLVLRSFNNECDYCIDNVKFNNIATAEARIEKSYDALVKLGRIMSVQISSEYKQSKLEELHLSHEYQMKKQDEKEEQKKIREELREQQKLEQEIRAAREKIEKERKHFKAALKSLQAQLAATSDWKIQGDINQKIAEIQVQLGDLDKEEKVIDYREKNAKAGYVYVISNIGAFGPNVYKIGMTRRLEPMDRVDELGDASVPFIFDVHAMIFSDNAPDLEAKIHQHCHTNRINKLNNRKEFFRAEITEIEKVIRDNYDKIVDVVKEAPAEQFRESLLVK